MIAWVSPTMAFGDNRFGTHDLWNLSKRSQSLFPGDMFRRNLRNHLWVLLCKISFLHRIIFQIKKLPRVFVVFFVETPVPPPGGNEMSALRITRFIVEPEEILVSITSFFSRQVRDQIHSITMLGNRLARQRGDRGIEVEIGNHAIVLSSCGDSSGHGEDRGHTDPAFFLRALSFAAGVGRR